MDNEIYRWVKASEAKIVTPDSTIRWKSHTDERWISCRAEAFKKDYYTNLPNAQILEPIEADQDEMWNNLMDEWHEATLSNAHVNIVDYLKSKYHLIKKS